MTSSSLEVLAGLALTTQEYLDLMIFKDAKPSDFYKKYVKEIQDKISENAAAEFHCIWREHARLQGAKPRTQISDELSMRLNNLQAELELSDLFDDVPSRRGVMKRAIPTTLVDQVGLDALLERLPETYQRALFSSWVASHYVSFNRISFSCCLPILASSCRSTNMVLTALVSTFSISLGISHDRLYLFRDLTLGSLRTVHRERPIMPYQDRQECFLLPSSAFNTMDYNNVPNVTRCCINLDCHVDSPPLM